MTTVQAETIARRKLSLLRSAQEFGNVSKACWVVGDSRQQSYEIRRSFQLYGADGLIDRLLGAKGPHPNRGLSRSIRRSWRMRWSIRPTGLSESRTS